MTNILYFCDNINIITYKKYIYINALFYKYLCVDGTYFKIVCHVAVNYQYILIRKLFVNDFIGPT